MGKPSLLLVPAVVSVAVLASCGGGGAGAPDELANKTCKQMNAASRHLAKTFKGRLVDLPEYRYLAAEVGAPAASFLPGKPNEGYATLLIYYCTGGENEKRTADEAFAKAKEYVDDVGGPAAAQKKYERFATTFQNPPD